MPIVNGKYQNPGWRNRQAPAINATELNAISDTLARLDAGGGQPIASGKSPYIIVGTTQEGATSEDCDYLCDGTADDVEINAAIEEGHATGKEIYILGGDYNITNTIKASASRSFTISGRNAGVTRLIGGGMDVMVDMFHSTLRNISLMGSSSLGAPDYLVETTQVCNFQNVSFNYYGQYAIYCPSSGAQCELYINRCDFGDVSRDYAIYLGSCDRTYITCSSFQAGIYISGRNTFISNIDNYSSKITLNGTRYSFVSNCHMGGDIELVDSDFCTITNNFFEGPYGITLDSNSIHNVVTGNGGGRTQIPTAWAGVTDQGSNNFVANNMPT